ncbi:hypothetical protein EV283_1032 [Sphingomonas sp. BK036]|uniref:hypothetical protein n=1 Tax=Sphingomonas sp. BK036 TaxID=2512122 RepID=UPI0010296812|nr:hypothetical protein [Sphingomonas sp. BK036]RZT56975.1 hypothetical protein EV283_1032 [Sphingomonas sp. BK036]
MTDVKSLLAEAAKIEAQAEAILNATIDAAHAAGTLDFRNRLLQCNRSAPLFRRVKELRAEAAGGHSEQAPVATATLAPSTPKASTVDRVAGLRSIAAANGTSAADLQAAIDGNVSIESFALSQAEVATAICAARARDHDIDSLVARVVGSDQPHPYANVKALRDTDPIAPLPPASAMTDSVEALAARIIAA